MTIIINRHSIDSSRERVDTVAKYVAREWERRNIAGVGSLARRWRGAGGEESAFHRQCHVFLIPVLLYLRRLRGHEEGPKQLWFDFCPYTGKCLFFRDVGSVDEDKDDVSLERQRRRRQLYVVEQSENSRTAAVRVRANFVRGWHTREEGEEKEEDEGRGEEKKEEEGTSEGRKYVRCRECLGRPFQSGDDGARSVYTFWNTLRFARTLGRPEFLITCLLAESILGGQDDIVILKLKRNIIMVIICIYYSIL